MWDRLRPVLEDMGIVINNTNVQERVYYVSNVPLKKKPTLTQRFGFKEFAGEVNSLHVVAVSDTETEVIGKSERNVEVEFEAAVEFFHQNAVLYADVLPGGTRVVLMVSFQSK